MLEFFFFKIGSSCYDEDDIKSEVVLHHVDFFIFFFQKVKPYDKRPVSIHFKSEVVLIHVDFTFLFFFNYL